ncbi:hypothetical protein EDD28_2171 [Salana multivorans]|uniref:Uncharacterized protein n=1 Tax=Salana multivorans TaxID=120377 RepID=A0A3N2DCR0_9MICO|nr:hypothetical protein [Salana multivorans]ROR97571.1 hypothetical protein EDD28_2171 [Salana multivorans]
MNRHLLALAVATAALLTRLADGIAGAVRARATAGAATPERGDVPGWVMITLMSAGLVAVIWVLADDWLRQLFQQAVDRVSGP